MLHPPNPMHLNNQKNISRLFKIQKITNNIHLCTVNHAIILIKSTHSHMYSIQSQTPREPSLSNHSNLKQSKIESGVNVTQPFFKQYTQIVSPHFSMESNDEITKEDSLSVSPSMELALVPFEPTDLHERRTKGRPRGSGKRQLLASLGEWFALSAGGNFTPHVVIISTGEDVATRIMSFARKGPRAISVLSANGSVSNVTLRQSGSCGGLLTYEGRFEILSLSGSFTLSENGGRSRTGSLTVLLAGPDGRLVGGSVDGSLLAASPIQVVVASFVQNTIKAHKRRIGANQDPSVSQIQAGPACASANPIPISNSDSDINI